MTFTSYPHVDPPLWLSIMARSPQLVVQALRLGGIEVADERAARQLLSQAGGRRLPLYGCAMPCPRARCRGFGATGKGCPGHRMERAA